MAMALYYLHEKKILHRDLKTQNIFLKHGRVRLGDFGIAKILDSTRELANTCIGTPYYMSPELFKQKPYSYKSDIWALGCIMYEICNLRHAFDAQSISGLAIKILNGQYTPLSTTYSKTLRELITKMLSINPKDRPTIWDIINKPIIKKRIVIYMAEIFSGNYPEASMPNDVDDIYIDSLREQAEKL
jgi:serine/threonine protein kinase